ncbi:MAG: rRNA maturation RNase YbeY [Proteobacteria bacterium]|nr:rRNA maturation RNase YbeY [Pseudomonadota bacterium]
MTGIEVVLINDDQLNSPSEQEFQIWADLASKHLSVAGEVCIKIITSEQSQALNQNYRNVNKPTNVLSFPAEIPEFVESDQLGDLAICAEVLEKEASQQNKQVNHHWAHLSIHGLLHLLGYDHVEDNQATIMEALEVKLLDQLDISNPY